MQINMYDFQKIKILCILNIASKALENSSLIPVVSLCLEVSVFVWFQLHLVSFKTCMCLFMHVVIIKC